MVSGSTVRKHHSVHKEAPKERHDTIDFETRGHGSASSIASSVDILPREMSTRLNAVYSIIISDIALGTSEAQLMAHIAYDCPSALNVRICRSETCASLRRGGVYFIDSLYYPEIDDAQYGQSLTGYINFSSRYERDWALAARNSTKLNNSVIRISRVCEDTSVANFSNGTGSRLFHSYRTIYVTNVSPYVDNRTLFDEFHSFGPIEQCRLDFEGHCGYIMFTSANSALHAVVHMHRKLVLGYRINVVHWPGEDFWNELQSSKYLLFVWTPPPLVTRSSIYNTKNASHAVDEQLRRRSPLVTIDQRNNNQWQAPDSCVRHCLMLGNRSSHPHEIPVPCGDTALAGQPCHEIVNILKSIPSHHILKTWCSSSWAYIGLLDGSLGRRDLPANANMRWLKRV